MTKDEVMAVINTAIDKAKAHEYEMVLTFNPSELVDEEGRIYADSLWYGGQLFYLKNDKGFYCSIEARGDVEATLTRKSDMDILVDMKDRNNAGYFRDEVRFYLHGDDELYDAEYKDDSEYYLDFQANNWFEGFVQTPYDDFFDVVDGNLLEIIEDVEGLIEWVEQ